MLNQIKTNNILWISSTDFASNNWKTFHEYLPAIDCLESHKLWNIKWYKAQGPILLLTPCKSQRVRWSFECNCKLESKTQKKKWTKITPNMNFLKRDLINVPLNAEIGIVPRLILHSNKVHSLQIPSIHDEWIYHQVRIEFGAEVIALFYTSHYKSLKSHDEPAYLSHK